MATQLLVETPVETTVSPPERAESCPGRWSERHPASFYSRPDRRAGFERIDHFVFGLAGNVIGGFDDRRNMARCVAGIGRVGAIGDPDNMRACGSKSADQLLDVRDQQIDRYDQNDIGPIRYCPGLQAVSLDPSRDSPWRFAYR